MIKTMEGIKVIDFDLAAAGPFIGEMLKNCGADCTLVEPLKGTHTRVVLNHPLILAGKKSLTLDAKSEQGREVMKRLIAEADVFITNYRSKALKNMGLTYEEVSAINPTIIYASIDGFGKEGPAVDHPGYDGTAFWARGSLLHTAAEGDTLPNPVSTVGDLSTAIATWGAVCAALYRREKTGKGMQVYSSLYQMGITLNFDAISQAQHGDKFPKSRHTPYRSLYNTYRCKDGKWIVITIPTLEKFFTFLRRVGRPELAESGKWKVLADTMNDGAPEVVKILEEIYGGYTREEAIAIMQELDFSCEPVQSVYEIIQDEQAAANKIFQERLYPQSGLMIKTPVFPPVAMGDSEPAPVLPEPRLGEHSVEILKGLGFSDAEIDQMIADHVTSDGSKEDLYMVK